MNQLNSSSIYSLVLLVRLEEAPLPIDKDDLDGVIGGVGIDLDIYPTPRLNTHVHACSIVESHSMQRERSKMIGFLRNIENDGWSFQDRKLCTTTAEED